MGATLRTRLALSFAAVALLAVLAVGVLANVVLEGAFQIESGGQFRGHERMHGPEHGPSRQEVRPGSLELAGA